MPITLQCPCGQPLTVEDQYVGSEVQCPACQRAVVATAKRKPAVIVVEEDEDDTPDRPAKKRKKKKKQAEGMTREEFDKWSEDQAIRSYYAKRLVYIVMGLLTAVGSVIALIVFLVNGMDGYIPLGAGGAGILGGLYVAYQGVTGTFHER